MSRDVLGQDAALARLTRMIKSGKVPSALLFHGPDGVGKRLAAHWFGELLNGGPNHAVLEVDAAFQAAVLDEDVEKIRTIRVDTVRELTRRASLRAEAGVWKVFIIDHAETFERQAANALLKGLEEAEPNTVWILLTARRERLLPTILSRCQTVAFKPLGEPLLRELGGREGIGDDLLDRWAPAAGGSLDRLKRLAQYGALVEQGRSDPGAYWTVAQGLGRDLNQARDTAEGVIDAILASRPARGSQALLKLRNSLRSGYVSPQLTLQLAFLETE